MLSRLVSDFSLILDRAGDDVPAAQTHQRLVVNSATHGTPQHLTAPLRLWPVYSIPLTVRPDSPHCQTRMPTRLM